jgi:integrase/recombinase XerD
MLSFRLTTGLLKEIVMLSKYAAPARIKAIRNGPYGALIEDFANELFRRGYAAISGRRLVGSAEHIVRWAGRRGLNANDLDERAIKVFGDHLDRCRCGRYLCCDRMAVLAGARLFIAHLQGVEPATREPPPDPADPDLLKAFCAWMREHRGTSDGTLYNYSGPIRALIRHFGEDPSKLDARRLRQFVLKRRAGWASAKWCTTALRMFLRFLVAEGQCPAGLLGAIPVLAHWRLASLPRCLPPEDVERIIGSCDLFSPMGKRDRAILLLLARLGLRAGDIVQMRLRDIDWKGGWIHVSGKSRRQTRLPLSQEVGQAIVAYVQDGRPAADTDALFLRARAPFRALRSHVPVSQLVASAICRAGIKRPARGAAHLLRHSIASSMLRSGASLQDISALLRHRSTETTQIYAKVDVTRLGQIAQPWPEVPSC